MGTLHVIDHPMIMHKLTLMRDKDTGAKDFRQLLNEISMLMGYEITRDLPTEDVAIETPVARMAAKKISGKKLAIVPILRAGLGMVDGLLSLIPVAKVGHIGLYRDPDTHTPVEYYCKMPPDISERIVILADPMLATGGSAVVMKKMGEQKAGEAREDFTFLILVNVLVGLVMCGLGYLVMDGIFHGMDLSPDVAAYCTEYPPSDWLHASTYREARPKN